MPSLFCVSLGKLTNFKRKKQTSARKGAEDVERCAVFTPSGSGIPKLYLLVVVLVEIKTAGNHRKLQNYGFQTSSEGPFIRPIPFYDAVSTLGLNASVHAQKRSVYAFQIVQNFLMELRQLLIQPYDPSVGFALIAFLPVWATGTVLTYIQLFRSAVLISADMDVRVMRKCLPVRTDHLTFFVSLEIHSTEGIFSVSCTLDRLVVHVHMRCIYSLFGEDVSVDLAEDIRYTAF